MLDVSLWELLIIGAIALVVVGPERLPRLMRTLGFLVGRARATFQSIRDEVEREVNVDGVRETRRAIDREADEAKSRVTDMIGEVEKPADTARSTESATPKSGGDESR